MPNNDPCDGFLFVHHTPMKNTYSYSHLYFITFQLVIELASDSKDFPTALAKAKLAEMTGKAKIVPIPQAPPSPKLAPKPPPAPAVTQKVSVEEPLAQGAPRGIGKKMSYCKILKTGPKN